MTEVVIRNKDMLEVLNGFSEEMLSKPSYNDEKYWTYHERKDIDLGSYYTSREYLLDCLSRDEVWLVWIGTSHNRFRKWCEKIRRCGETSCRRSSMTLRQNLALILLHYSPTIRWRVRGLAH